MTICKFVTEITRVVIATMSLLLKMTTKHSGTRVYIVFLIKRSDTQKALIIKK